jgi:predicted O-methyltransferase YrrM
MHNILGQIRSNLRPRVRLLLNVLSRRYIWSDVGAMAREHCTYNDVTGDVDPLSFARAVFGTNESLVPAPPDVSDKLGLPSSFTPPGAPEFFMSEPSVVRFLSHLVFYRKPAVVVELGCFVGWASAHLAVALQANGHGKLYCVDCDQKNLDATMKNLKRLGVDEVTNPLLGKSTEPAVVAGLPNKIDILFIDTSHTYRDTLDEILLYSSRLAETGCMVLHDSISFPGVRRAISETSGKFRILTFATESGNGVSVLLRSNKVATANAHDKFARLGSAA